MDMLDLGPRQQAITLVDDFYAALEQGAFSWDKESPVDAPLATADHYDKFARAIVAMARTRPDGQGTTGEDAAIESIRNILPILERIGEYRRSTLELVRKATIVAESDHEASDKAAYAKAVAERRAEAEECGMALPESHEIP